MTYPEPPGPIQIQLFADPAFDVLLYDLDLGSHLSDRTINSVTVSEILGADVALASSSNVLVAGGASHTSLSFGPPLQAHFLQITIDASNLVGDERQLIGVDNIRFGQIERATPVVETPGPATRIPLGAGLAAVQIGRRRR